MMRAMDPGTPDGDSTGSGRVVVQIASGTVSVALAVALFFWAAGRIDWIAGWVYIGYCTVCHSLSALYLWRRNPDLLRRRGRIGAGTGKWDVVWLAVFGLLVSTILVVAALDAGRYQWSSTPFWMQWIGAGLYAVFVIVLTWAMAVNPHFEKTVRIQHDREHRVIDTGPYRWIRHPGYLALLLGFVFGPPLLLGSSWALAPASLAAVWIVVRTALEDRYLHAGLSGYAEYAQRVRYRLLPRIW